MMVLSSFEVGRFRESEISAMTPTGKTLFLTFLSFLFSTVLTVSQDSSPLQREYTSPKTHPISAFGGQDSGTFPPFTCLCPRPPASAALSKRQYRPNTLLHLVVPPHDRKKSRLPTPLSLRRASSIPPPILRFLVKKHFKIVTVILPQWLACRATTLPPPSRASRCSSHP